MRLLGVLAVAVLCLLAGPSARAEVGRPTPSLEGVVGSADSLRGVATDILSGPEYQRQLRGDKQPGALLRLWARIVQWLKDALSRPLLEGLEETSPAAFWAFVGLLAALLVLIIIHFVVTLRAALRGEGPRAAEEASPTPGGILRARDLLAGADRAATQGEYREAIRLLYLALLSRLDQQGVITYDQTRTNWEYLRATRAMTALHRPFSELTAVFDRKWYGSETALARDYALCRELWEEASAGGAG